MDCQMFSDKIYIVFRVLGNLFYGNGVHRTALDTFRKFPAKLAHTEVASRTGVGDKIPEDDPKGAGNGTGFAACATHTVALDVPVGRPLQGMAIARIDARRLFAMPADRRKSRVFAQRRNAIVLRMIKIIAAGAALSAAAANIQVDKKPHGHLIPKPPGYPLSLRN
jgi:hypothetical protein